MKLEEKKAEDESVDCVQDEHQQMQNILQLIRQLDCFVVDSYNFIDALFNGIAVDEEVFQISFQALDFAMNETHEWIAKDQYVDKEDVDSVKCQRHEKHVRDCDGDEENVDQRMVVKLESVAVESTQSWLHNKSLTL